MGGVFGAMEGAIIEGDSKKYAGQIFRAIGGGMHEIEPVARCLYELHQPVPPSNFIKIVCPVRLFLIPATLSRTRRPRISGTRLTFL
jgi:hypothetical protein